MTPSTTQADSAAGYDVNLAFPAPRVLCSGVPRADHQRDAPTRRVDRPGAVGGAAAARAPSSASASPGRRRARRIGGRRITALDPVFPGTLTGGVYSLRTGSRHDAGPPFHVSSRRQRSGLDVKVRGHPLNADPSTGQLIATFSRSAAGTARRHQPAVRRGAYAGSPTRCLWAATPRYAHAVELSPRPRSPPLRRPSRRRRRTWRRVSVGVAIAAHRSSPARRAGGRRVQPV